MHRKFKYRITTVRPIVGLPWYVTYLFFNDFHVLKITSCQLCLNAGDLPEHKVVGMPNLSPTMETGTIISWMKKEGKVLVGLTIMIILQFENWKTKLVKTSYLCIIWLPIWLDLTIPLSIHILHSVNPQENSAEIYTVLDAGLWFPCRSYDSNI